ncbi:APC membrane recruitment protein 1 [Arapaima gigas]
MEPSRGSEPRKETKPLSDGCGETAGGSEDLQPETELPSECKDAARPEPQPPGKLRKTAFKLFGSRRSICVLPSFFGGRIKSHGKGSSKKGIIKSKTHDCISKVSWEDARKASDVPAGDFEYHDRNGLAGKSLTNSRSVDVVNDCEGLEFTGGESSHLLTIETGDHKPTLDKSLSFNHPKRGLKGLFSSIRRHKKNKNIKIEKSEVGLPKEAETVFHHHVDHHEEDLFSSLAESNVPPSANVKDNLVITHECEHRRTSSEDISKVSQENLKTLKDGDDDDDEKERTLAINTNVELLSKCARLQNVNPECAENDQPLVQSSDQISLIFGEVSSLKSFDSLTGCGDIIADQDDDSIAESSVSGERSRNAGKRSSCFVTYQGGGEEMATPDEIDGDYLQGLWESDAAADICYVSDQEPDKVLEKTPDASATPSSIADVETRTMFSHDTTDSLSPEEVLSPQSDHQESVPNSDEGYYDSTTPGPDDDGVDGVGHIGSDRLPRDSYSGDALYELFEPDDSLMSPPLKEMSSFETQKHIQDPLEFLGRKLHVTDADLQSSFTRKTCAIETEEVRLTKIQHELLCSELQSMQKLTKDYVIMGKSRCYPEKESEFMLSKKVFFKDGQNVLNLSSKGKDLLQGVKSLKENNKNEILARSQTASDGPPSVVGSEICNGHISQTVYKLQEPASYGDKGSRRALPTGNEGHGFSMNIIKMDAEPDRTICFSQALVDFTKRTELLNNLSASLRGAEPNSEFAQNIQVLPSMVTFDVVDMENEGEYDNQVQMVATEDISSPFEDYSESFLQKDAFAECDDRLFDFNDQSLFLNNPWGVASLPRHLSLTRVNQPLPAPLSLNRRSRSLDTDCLEFEMSDFHLAQSRVSPFATLRLENDSNGSSPLQHKRSGNSASSETDNARGTTASWQPEPAGTSALPLTDGKRASQVPSLVAAQKERARPACAPTGRSEAQSLGQAPGRNSRPQVPRHAVLERRPCNPAPQFCPRTQAGECVLGPPSPLTERAADALCERAGRTPDNRAEARFSKSGTAALYPDSTHQLSRAKPVGVTQGVPHFRCDSGDASKLAVRKDDRDLSTKGSQAVDAPLAAGCNKHAYLCK